MSNNPPVFLVMRKKKLLGVYSDRKGAENYMELEIQQAVDTYWDLFHSSSETVWKIWSMEYRKQIEKEFSVEEYIPH